MRTALFTLLCLASAVAFAQQPVAYVEKPGQTRLIRLGSQAEVKLATGQLLFAGDRVSVTGPEEAVIWFCPARQIVYAARGASVVFESTEIRRISGPAVALIGTPFCSLPRAERTTLFRPRYLNWTPIATPTPVAPVTPDQIRGRILPGQESLFQELQAAQAATDADPANVMARISKGAVLERLGLDVEALKEFRMASASPGIQNKAWVHQTQTRVIAMSRFEPPATPVAGRTLAVLVGISKYDREDRALRYARRDAEVFYNFLRSPRGGSLPEEQVALLVDERATNERIISEMKRMLIDRARTGDTVIFFISAHGANEDGRPYLIPTDAHPDNLHDSAIDMRIIGELMEFGVNRKCRVLIFLDVCRAGSAIGPNASGSDFGMTDDSEMLVMTATTPRRPAIEAEQFGGGHSAFSYFVLKGLNGEADADKNQRIESRELARYVRDQVESATGDCQEPQTFFHLPERTVLVPDLRMAGIELADWTKPPGCGEAPPEAFLGQEAPAVKGFEGRSPVEREFLDLISRREFDENTWFDALDKLEIALAGQPGRYREMRDDLRSVLQNRGQQVILRYLDGEARPQIKADFIEGEQYYHAALRLDPEAPALLGRYHFCRGRRLIFDKQYAAALAELDEAVLYDPEGPYVFNAFGIAHLEQGQISLASSYFREAQRLAPRWLYPRHNLALALAEDGQFDRARAILVAAMRQAPAVPYLPYSQGLLELRVNRLEEAAKAFRSAIQIDPKRAFGYDALAFVLAARGKNAEAERNYREALARDPEAPAILHNYALLLARLGRSAEAETAWKKALEKDQDFASGLAGLAEFYASKQAWQEVVPLAERLHKLRPEYAPARMLLAKGLTETGHALDALSRLESAAGSPEVLILRGDILVKLGRRQEALSQYREAQRHAGISPTLKREIRKRIRSVAE